MKLTLLALPLLLALTACGGGGSIDTPAPQPAPISSSSSSVASSSSSSSVASSSSSSSLASSSSSSSKPTTILAPTVGIIGQVTVLTLDTAESIASVTWFLDATQIGTGTTYRWTIPNLAGAHLLLAVYTNSSGKQTTIRKSIQLVLNLPPVLLVSSPIENETLTVANGLNILGVVTTNKPTAITVTATLGSLPIGIGAEPDSGFSGYFDITGLPAGTYKLTVTAKDSLNLIATKVINVVIK